MTTFDDKPVADPVENWLQDHGVRRPALRCSVTLAAPGGALLLRTNDPGMAGYVRDRCRHFLQPGKARPSVIAEVLCLPGKTWPAVRPRHHVEQVTTEAFTTFQSFSREGIICAWKPPALMGSLRRDQVPQIRILTTELNPRLLPRVLDGQRLRLNGAGLKYPSVLDLLFCLLGRHHGFSVLHGAVLEKEGLGVLMLGESGCGKTTAALTLLRGGFRLLTDEYAVLWNRGKWRGQFSGLLVPPMVVGQPCRTLQRLEDTLERPARFGKHPFPVPTRRLQNQPVKVATLLALKRPESRAVEHHAVRLSPEDAFASLMFQLRDPVRSERSDAFETMLEVLATVRACQVIVGRELKSFPDFVFNLATKPGGGS